MSIRLEGTGAATIAPGAAISIGASNAIFRRSVENFGTLRLNNNIAARATQLPFPRGDSRE
jgi:hypothetical protein